jgi:hypothetical protein
MMQPFFHCGQDLRTLRRWFFIRAGFFLALLCARDVLAFPQITTEPVTANISIGQTTTFTVAVAQIGGTSPLYVQWRRNGANIPGTIELALPGLGYSTYTISNTQAGDAGSYSAVVYDIDGAVSTMTVNLFLTNLTALTIGNVFANRGTVSLGGGTGSANNLISTSEAGTPRNNNIPGGGMVWLEAYTPPSSGIVTVDTRGSDFDTTLGIYQISTNNNSAAVVTNLVAVIADDDGGDYFNSAVSFNATPYAVYEIGVDGYYGSRGHIVLNWSFQYTTNQLPVIIQQPQSKTVLPNASVFLSVAVGTNTFNTSPLFYQWFFNGAPIKNATQPAYTISAVSAATVGQYRVQVGFANQDTNYTVMSSIAEVQINSQGNTRAIAQAKLHQTADPNSYPGGPVPLMPPVSGYTGSQIWHTYGSEEEPGEPNHCGKVGGSPYWFSYTPASNGTLTVDAYTPTYTNVLAIYTWPGGSNYNSLVSMACASTNPGVGHEIAVFPVTYGTTNYMVVDGLNSGYGQVTLNWSLTAPPAIVTQPQSQTVPQGSNVTLSVSATGSPSPWYQWRTNALKWPGQTNFSLTVTNFQATNQGNYDVVVTNLLGAVTSSVATLYLNSPLRFGSMTFSPTGGFAAILLGMASSNYVLQASTNLATTNWVPVLTNSSPFGIVPLADTNTQNHPNRFYRTVKP